MGRAGLGRSRVVAASASRRRPAVRLEVARNRRRRQGSRGCPRRGHEGSCCARRGRQQQPDPSRLLGRPVRLSTPPPTPHPRLHCLFLVLTTLSASTLPGTSCRFMPTVRSSRRPSQIRSRRRRRPRSASPRRRPPQPSFTTPRTSHRPIRAPGHHQPTRRCSSRPRLMPCPGPSSRRQPRGRAALGSRSGARSPSRTDGRRDRRSLEVNLVIGSRYISDRADANHLAQMSISRSSHGTVRPKPIRRSWFSTKSASRCCLPRSTRSTLSADELATLACRYAWC